MILLAGFLVIVAMLAFVTTYALSEIQGMTKTLEDIDQMWMQSVTLMGCMIDDVSDVEHLALAIIVETEKVKL
ncbi:hypothetical protein [Paenibacillus illinoisensis]|nr:hypothetical protein [Paenibacillus illinoisensis]